LEGRGHPHGRRLDAELSPSELQPESLVAIGKVLKPHGVRGEIRVQILTDFPERFHETPEVHLVSPEGSVLPKKVEAVRFHSAWVLVKLAGIQDPESAAKFRGWLVSVPETELVELESDEYWHFQLEGLEVRDESGTVLGRLEEVLQTPGHDLYSVRGPSGEVLIPAVAEFVVSVDLEAGQMVVRPPVLEA